MSTLVRVAALVAVGLIAAVGAAPGAVAHTSVGVDGNHDNDCDDKNDGVPESASVPAGGTHVCVTFD